MSEIRTMAIDGIDVVTISRREYDYMLISVQQLSMIADSAFRSASLSWNKQDLRIDGDKIGQLLKLLAFDRYMETLKELTEAEYGKSDQNQE